MPRLKVPHMAECHPDRPHRARGMCSACYFQDWRAITKIRKVFRRRVAEMRAA